MTKTKKFLEQLTIELYKLLLLLSGILITTLFSGMAGYGYLHYVQGLTLMSSPITLMQAFVFSGIVAFFITISFVEKFQRIMNKLSKGEN